MTPLAKVAMLTWYLGWGGLILGALSLVLALLLFTKGSGHDGWGALGLLGLAGYSGSWSVILFVIHWLCS